MQPNITEITYEDAANVLGVKHGTITNAVNRGVLNALPRRRRKPGRLALEQVQLFKGKELSLTHLSTEEAIIWHEVNRYIGNIGKVPASNQLDMTAKSMATFTDLINRVTDLAVDAIVELQNTQPTDLTPDKLVSALMGSKAFNQMALLIGLDMSDIPEETKQAMQNVLFTAVSNAAMRIAAIQLASAASAQIDQEK